MSSSLRREQVTIQHWWKGIAGVLSLLLLGSRCVAGGGDGWGGADDDWETRMRGAIVDMLFAVELLRAKSDSSLLAMTHTNSREQRASRVTFGFVGLSLGDFRICCALIALIKKYFYMTR